MPTIRWYRSEVADAARKIRWYRSEVAVTAPPVSPTIRWYRSEVVGNTVVSVLPLSNLSDVEPFDTITLNALIATGSPTPDSYTWRQVSGGATTLTGTGNTRSFVAPADYNGTTVVIGVKATKDGVDSVERQVSIAVLPHQRWRPSGGVWVPVHLVSLV